MKGSISKSGRMIIEVDLNFEQLAAPCGRQYLPCDGCGKILTAIKEAVSVLCVNCTKKADEGDEEADDDTNYQEPCHESNYP